MGRFSFSLTIITIFTFLCHPSLSLYSKNCHYTCTYCIGSEYDHCIICQQGLQLNAIKNRDRIGQQYYNWLEDHPWGTCLGQMTQFNMFGVVAFWVGVGVMVWVRNRTVFYFFNALQTFALLSMIEVASTPIISYVLQGFEYFMFISAINKSSKQQNSEIFDDGRYRMYEFLREYDFQANFLPVFLFSLLAFVLAFLMPLCKHFAKKQGSLWTVCSCINLPKVFTFIQISSIVIFFFLIQESVLMIVIGIFLNSKFIDDGGNIGLVVAYALMFMVMVINMCSKNLDVFPNKATEQVEIVKKCLTPIFVIVPVKMGVMLAGFMFVISLIGLVFSRIRATEKTLTEFHQRLIKRQLIYRIIELLAIGAVIAFWIVENYVMTLDANNFAGIAATAVLGLYLLCFLIETGIILYGKYFKKQDQRLYQIFTNSMSSMRQTKMVQQTIQNFQTTQEGIMDMIFFGRNIQQKQSPNKRNNIQLDLDNLNEEYDPNGDGKSSKSVTTSPKNRQKGKTSRTPKYDRSSRFKLNKAFEPENKEIQIQYVQMKQETRTNNENIDGQKSQRSQNVHPESKTTQRDKSLNIVKTRTELNEQNEEKSPRFGYNQESHTKFQRQQKNSKNQGNLSSRNGTSKEKKHQQKNTGKSSLN